jgi:hypothetical protein
MTLVLINAPPAGNSNTATHIDKTKAAQEKSSATNPFINPWMIIRIMRTIKTTSITGIS